MALNGPKKVSKPRFMDGKQTPFFMRRAARSFLLPINLDSAGKPSVSLVNFVILHIFCLMGLVVNEHTESCEKNADVRLL